jgi:hypothetical protein
MLSFPRTRRIGALLFAATVTGVVTTLACSESNGSASSSGQTRLAPTEPSRTTGTGTSSKLLGRATFSDPKDRNFKVKRITGDWHVEVKSMPALDVAVQTIDFAAGAQSGWHSHPGPVFIVVSLGTMSFYESDDPTCTPIVLSKNQGYLDKGEHAHIARNESGAAAQTVVTYLVPPDSGLRSDQPRPGNCPF